MQSNKPPRPLKWGWGGSGGSGASGDGKWGVFTTPEQGSRVALTQMRHQLLGSGGSGASGVKIQNLLYKTKKKEKGVSSFFFFSYSNLGLFTPLPPLPS